MYLPFRLSISSSFVRTFVFRFRTTQYLIDMFIDVEKILYEIIKGLYLLRLSFDSYLHS